MIASFGVAEAASDDDVAATPLESGPIIAAAATTKPAATLAHVTRLFALRISRLLAVLNISVLATELE
jgi:hypothetical protein